MQVGKCVQNACTIKYGCLVRDTILILSMDNVEKLPSLDKRKQQIQILLVLEARNKTQDQGMIYRTHNLLLTDYPFHLISLQQLSLVDGLKRVRSFFRLLAGQPHFSKSTWRKLMTKRCGPRQDNESKVLVAATARCSSEFETAGTYPFPRFDVS